MDNQIWQEKLMDELDVFELRYLESIIFETFRLYPTGPLLVPQISFDGCIIGGYDIPHDTMLLVNAWAIRRDPKLWDNAISFKLTRFEIGEGDGDKLIPFGLGKRVCPGIGLAQCTLNLTSESLIQCIMYSKDLSVVLGTLSVDRHLGLYFA